MPKKIGRARRRGAGGVPFDGGVECEVFFRGSVTHYKATNGYQWGELNLTTANLGTRVADLCWDFEYFRLRKLEAYLHTAFMAGVQDVAIESALAFDVSPTAFNVPPTNADKTLEFRHAALGGIFHMPRISVGPKELLRTGPLPWFHTQPTGTPDASESSNGTIWYMLGVNTAVTLPINAVQTLVFSGVVEFSTPVDPALSRARRGELTIPPSVKDDPAVVKQLARLKEVIALAGDEMDTPGPVARVAAGGAANAR